MARKTFRNVVDVKSVARAYTETAMNTLLSVARSSKAPAAARVTAATALLDRGWGKPDQTYTGSGDIKVTIRQIIEHIGEKPRQLEVIDGECSHVDVDDSIDNRTVDDENDQ